MKRFLLLSHFWLSFCCILTAQEVNWRMGGCGTASLQSDSGVVIMQSIPASNGSLLPHEGKMIAIQIIDLMLQDSSKRYEICIHRNYIGGDTFNLHLSQRYAEQLSELLLSDKASSNCSFVVRGLGEQQLLFSKEVLEQEKDEVRWRMMCILNSRIEIRYFKK